MRSSSVADTSGGPASAGDEQGSLSGLAAALAAFLIWGFLPVFWKALASVDSFEVLCHRIVWSFCALLPFMFLHGRLGGLLLLLRRPRTALTLLFSGVLLAGNWLLYIWAIASGMVLETSLGYYINPLVNILFGLAVFREKVSRLGWAAICLALAGVLHQVVALGHLPLVPLGLALSFGVYGLIRKLLMVEALPALFVETLVVLPLAVGYLLRQGALGNSAFFRGDLTLDLLLTGAGVATTVPLLLFAYGAKRIRMTTLGVLQYVNPTCVFLLGVFVYDEPLSSGTLLTFICIWVALALYAFDTARARRW